MAPRGDSKRKRDSRVSMDAAENRPSPHRPGNTNLGQQDRGQDLRNGSRRPSRGGQGPGRGGRRNDDRNNPNNLTISARATPTPGQISSPGILPSAAPTPTATPSPVVKHEIAPYNYAFLTDDRVASWATNGREELASAGIQARQDENSMDLATIFQELIRGCLDGRMGSTEGGSCIKDILGSDVEPVEGIFHVSTYFLDVLSMVFDAEEHPVNPALRSFVATTNISPNLMRQKLDAQLLQFLGLTRDTFIRVGIRQATHLLYRQANYNLLREESEGYSKLATELFVRSGGSTLTVDHATQENAKVSFERVKGLIGTFDLDVGRVLDITLDVFASLLIKQYRFFVMLLRASSWWPKHGLHSGNQGLPSWAVPGSSDSMEVQEANRLHGVDRDIAFWERARAVGLDAFFELGGRQVVDAESKSRISSDEGDADMEMDADRKWIETTGTFPPAGNRIAAQLLGFKLRYYASEARNKDETLPPNLMYLVALLIKIGFVSLRDLYPHLWPLDENMPAVKETKEKELVAKNRANRPGGGATNALTMAGALADDTVPTSGRTRELATKAEEEAKPAVGPDDKEKLPEPSDQKILLLVNLLTIGALPEALFILGRFPWIPDVFPEVLPLINRILEHSIKDVYAKARPTASQSLACPSKKYVDPDQSGMPKGSIRLAQGHPKNLLRWPFPEQYDEGAGGSNYKFYWENWADIIPVCQSVDDIFTLCGTLLNYSSVNIGLHPALLSKLARIGVMSLTQDGTMKNRERWQDLLKRVLVPALSLTKSNTSVVNEVYEMLRFYPVSIRYTIYTEWFEGRISRLPAMKVAFDQTRLDTVATMKRISKTNLLPMARRLAKSAYSSPGVVFKVALGQIEAYTNLTEVVVECAKYFTDLGYDVLVWSLMSSLGGQDRSRNNADFALLPSRWLLALSRFAGRVFHRHSSMHLSPIIQYINHQLYRGHSTDLVILKELISQMAGIVPDTDFTDSQLTAMTGGEALRRYTLINLQDKRYESTKTAKRLMKALTETKLAGQLLLSMAQHKQSAIYRVADGEAHIKLLATMIDDAQLILYQYLDLLRSNLSPEEFDEHVPGIPELMTDFGLAAPLAFLIGRASVVQRISQLTPIAVNGTSKSPSSEVALQPDAEGDVGMKEEESTRSKDQEQDQNVVKTNEDVQMVEGKENTPAESPPTEGINGSSDPYRDLLEPITSCVKSLLPERSWSAITPDLYATFWISTLKDLSRPDALYLDEIKKIQEQERLVMLDRSNTSPTAIARKDETRKKLIETRETILTEMHIELESFTKGRIRMLKRKSQWFQPSIKADMVSDEFLEKCLIPRVLLSPTDADFAFRMIRFLHDNGVPNFRTLSLYGRLFRPNRLRSIIFTCTVREAENLGRFLKLVLADLQKWHANAKNYEEQAWGKRKNLPGFAKALDSDGTPKGLLAYEGETSFKNVLFSWHKNLNIALKECLSGTEWMHIRNTITVLKTVGEVFPAIDFMGKNFIEQLETLSAREKNVREDLALTGNAVLVQLKRRQKKWVMVQAFGYNLPSNTAITNGSAARSSSQSQTSTPKSGVLKPTAPPFQPQSRASSSGVPTPKPGEDEDGEVDDTKTKNTTSTPRSVPDAKSTGTPQAAPPPQRSEILIKREQIKAEQKAAQANSAPTRLDSSRPHIPSTLTDRIPPGLPTRPEGPVPSNRHGDRHHHPDRRDGRDSRLPEPGRLERSGDRQGERPSDRSRDYPTSSRRGPEAVPREFVRNLDRAPIPERERSRPEPPPRWTADSSRENSERNLNAARSNDNAGRLSRDNTVPLPRSSVPSVDRGVPLNSERIHGINPERQELINPERAALITSADPRSQSPRRHGDDPRERPSRQRSPRRHDRDYTDPKRDDRPNRATATDAPVQTPSRRHEDLLATPLGPRSDKPTERALDRNDRTFFQPTPPAPRQIDPDHGRLNAGSRQQPADPNFGRLNANSPQDIPSGPRDRNIRGNNRVSNVNGPRGDTRIPIEQQMPRPPTPEKQPPTGPSSGRHPRRSASGQFDTKSFQPGSAPSTPTTGTPTGVHPDRMRQLPIQIQQHAPHHSQHNLQHAPQNLPQHVPLPTTAPIHPDRLSQLGNNAPPITPSPNNQINNHRSRPSVPTLNTAGPPSGPKGSQAMPIAPASNNMAPPTGPATAQERAQRGGRRQLAGINNMLQQAGGPINVRGRGSIRAGGMQQDSPTSMPHNQIPPPPPGPPPGRPGPRDGGNDRDLVNPARADLIAGGDDPFEDREKERGSRRSGRHSRRSSRSPDRPREPKRGPGEEERSSRGEYRDLRGGDREPDRERHQGRSPHRADLIPTGGLREVASRENHREREPGRRERGERDAAREPQDASRDNERGSERIGGSGRNRDPRGDGRGGEDLTRGGRGEDRRGDGRDGGRSRADEGRKRRSEGDPNDPRGHNDKRPRRN